MFATAMAQGELGDGVDIFLGDGVRPAPGGVGPGGAQPDQIGAQTIDTGGKAALGNLRQRLIVEGNVCQCAACVLATLTQRRLRGSPIRRRNLADRCRNPGDGG